MSLKLFIIGDSVSQGFMSGAAARPELAYGTILSELLEVDDFSYLEWEEGKKLKVDLEQILRSLESKYGKNINMIEMLFSLKNINKLMDSSEEYFERGDGSLQKKVETSREWFHNVAVEGMDVADAWIVTPTVCKQTIVNDDYDKSNNEDEFLKTAGYPFYRNARRVLNPQNDPKYDKFSAIEWLNYHSKNEGIENTIIWLGANNALGTIIDMDIRMSKNDQNKKSYTYARKERSKWNLWHPNDFSDEYDELMRRVEEAMEMNKCDDWKVFIGTVPFLTILPLAKGMGEQRHVTVNESGFEDLKGLYYQYYSYIPLSLETALENKMYLKFRDAIFIDKCISRYNDTIKQLVEKANAKFLKQRYFIVDTCKMLSDAAWKRNCGNPTYKFPEYVQFRYPVVDSKYYHADKNGFVEKGGMFSLDGLHPSAIGQGLIANEFLKVMKNEANLPIKKEIDWMHIYKNDSLYSKPIRIMHELYDNEKLINTLLPIIKLIKKK